MGGNAIKKLSEAYEKYGKSGNSEFFKLKNDRDKAVVRFLFAGENDIDFYVVHRVKVGDKFRHVLCKQEEGYCPLCNSGNKPQLKLFLQLVEDGDDTVKIWERGKTFVPIILGLIDKYSPLHSRQFEVERFGKPNDMKTTYQIYPLDEDGKRLEDLPEKVELVGPNALILDKTVEDMEAIANGTYQPPTQDGDEGDGNPPWQNQRRNRRGNSTETF